MTVAVYKIVYTENLGTEPAPEVKVSAPSDHPEAADPKELVPVLTKAWEQYQDEDGWANVAPAGSFVKRAAPDFDPRTYGAAKLPDIIRRLSGDFEMTKFKGKGTVNIVAYRPKKS